VVTDDTAVKALTRIAQLCVDRMNQGVNVTPQEAFTLGAITQIAGSVPDVLDGVQFPAVEPT
jgi:hypothetical protein